MFKMKIKHNMSQRNMLCIFDEIEKLDAGYVRRVIPYLSEERRDKVLSYHFPIDRKLSAAAYLLLRSALKEIYGIDEPVTFSYGEHGKPFLRDYQKIHFNLSHCSSAVACVISESEAGVDVQDITPVSDGMARRVLTAGEYAAFKSASNPFEEFCECWVVKESWLKRTGQGLGVDLTELSAEGITEKMIFNCGKNYIGCVSGNVECVKICLPSEIHII